MDFENKWEPEESDDEYEEEEYIQNEVLPPDVDQEFRNNVMNVKHILYDNTILKPELGTSQVQNNRLLEEYLQNINQLYVLSLNAQKGIVNESELNQLYNIHKSIWDLEAELKSGVEESLSLEEIGRRAIKIRNMNNQRIALKNIMADKLNQADIHEIKKDHLSE